ncbi:MAG: hypothetical protein KC553_05760 [Nitrospina sp.]|nr:hypothetical protein [Nitrospina sp.]
MSYRIALNGWSGNDQEEAAQKIAKIFRLGEEEAAGIVQGLVEGNGWQFEHGISGKQSEMAENFLTSLGFDVERQLLTDEEMPLETGNGKGGKGIWSKIWEELNKKR